MEIKGIDVSSWQELPDWKRASASGIAFAILRVTERHGVDTSFEYNYKGCRDNGIPVGVYKYSYALSLEEIRAEADGVVQALNGRALDFPVWLDLEWEEQRGLGSGMLDRMIETFRSVITAAGYMFGIYCNVDWYNNYIPQAARDKYDFWLAAYPADDDGTVRGRLRPSAGVAWQYSSAGKVPGIAGKIDMDIFFKDYSKKKKQGAQEAEVKKKAPAMTVEEVIDKVLKIAGEEVGYLEKCSNSNLDSKTGNAGSSNYTKYWRDIKPDYQGEPWCAAFVSWCLMKSFGLENARGLLKHWPYVYCPTLGELFTKYANPKAGDIVIFYRNGTFAHTGFVTKVSGDQFWTIEGNTSSGSQIIANGGGVFQKSYYNSNLPGTKFCRPDYASMLGKIDSKGKADVARGTESTPKQAGLTKELNLRFPEVSKGTRGVAVAMLQTMLGTKATAVWKEEDINAFRSFQRNTNQADDGICGENGWRAVIAHMNANTYK